MLEYKARWKGVTTIQLTKSETYGSSSECSACGEKLRSPARDDATHRRMLWCQRCNKWIDRDVNAALNLSTRGLASSRPPRQEEGGAGEAVKGEPDADGNPQSRCLEVDSSACADKLTEPPRDQGTKEMSCCTLI